jgi:hypothetical protein
LIHLQPEKIKQVDITVGVGVEDIATRLEDSGATYRISEPKR